MASSSFQMKEDLLRSVFLWEDAWLEDFSKVKRVSDANVITNRVMHALIVYFQYFKKTNGDLCKFLPFLLPGNFSLPAENTLISRFKRLVSLQKNKRKFPEIAESPFFSSQLSNILIAPT